MKGFNSIFHVTSPITIAIGATICILAVYVVMVNAGAILQITLEQSASL